MVGTSNIRSNNNILYLGNYQFGGQQWGNTDEIRISTGIARAPSWIATEYNNQSSPSAFYAVGSEVGGGGGGGGGVTQSIVVGTSTYVRYFYLSDVYRDSSGNIVTSNGSYDPSTKRVTVAYNWLGGAATNTMSIYLVRSQNNVVTQNDWSGGPGQTGPATSTNNQFTSSTNIDYSTTTGSIYVAIPGY